MCVILVPRRPAPFGYHLVPTKRSAAFPNESVFAYESAGHVVYREYWILITGRVVVHFVRVVESFTCAPPDISFKGKSFFFYVELRLEFGILSFLLCTCRKSSFVICYNNGTHLQLSFHFQVFIQVDNRDKRESLFSRKPAKNRHVSRECSTGVNLLLYLATYQEFKESTTGK